jgi:hypothetical protein
VAAKEIDKEEVDNNSSDAWARPSSSAAWHIRFWLHRLDLPSLFTLNIIALQQSSLRNQKLHCWH